MAKLKLRDRQRELLRYLATRPLQCATTTVLQMLLRRGTSDSFWLTLYRQYGLKDQEASDKPRLGRFTYRPAGSKGWIKDVNVKGLEPSRQMMVKDLKLRNLAWNHEPLLGSPNWRVWVPLPKVLCWLPQTLRGRKETFWFLTREGWRALLLSEVDTPFDLEVEPEILRDWLEERGLLDSTLRFPTEPWRAYNLSPTKP